MRLILLFILIFYPTNTIAATCTPYEMKVFKLADEAQIFQKSKAFKTYGWSKAGPTNGWLDRFKQSRNQEKELQFFRNYGFLLAEVYQVADEYRTAGTLDSFYQDIENNIKKTNRCNY